MGNQTKIKDFKGFAKLVERVAKIDEDSAVWLIENQSKLNLSGRLIRVMAWEYTPQGRNHWQEIYGELGELYND